MSNEVYIHVGIEKTGSTFLQSAIEKNRRLLKKSGMHWVRSGTESGHHYWLAKALDFKYKSGYICEATEKQALLSLKKEVENNQNSRLLLSSEHFDFNVSVENTSRLRQCFAGRRLIVIICLRNQLDYCQSLYIEHLKWGGTQDFEAFINLTLRQQRYDYYRRYQCWRDAGAEVRVIDYDDAKGELIDRFFKAIDQEDILPKVSVPVNRENVTPSIDLMEFVRLLNVGIQPELRRENYQRIVDSVRKKVPELLVKRAFPIPPSCIKEFTKQSALNEELAKIYSVDPEYFLRGNVSNRVEKISEMANPSIEGVIAKYFA
ncbi:hypothetical protein MARLIPOL_01170 [Marinobacter lipolyticus SM19]|uniref:Sulfotransferase domain-containing protein n=1 Tax=Marinobacter lipolyticus SM19 TaxID=1318628 RepID=R8B5M6_9GAMM|nr:hypothetical protein [Marinobacter lipolyticus]EON93897.1 hypothetical protein MARLIPOL_01170 [Marinobacter lipolyticus SM19]